MRQLLGVLLVASCVETSNAAPARVDRPLAVVDVHAGDRSVATGAAELWDVDRATTAGRVTIAASPATVYALATDYADWPNVLTDVIRVDLLDGGADDGLVEFKSRALGRTVTVRFANTPNVVMAFTLVEGPPGAVATGTYELTATEDGASTIMTAELYMEVTGAPGLFVSDERVRKMRRNKLRADLDDLAAYFAPDAMQQYVISPAGAMLPAGPGARETSHSLGPS